jgi:hypothetical protein
LTIHSFHKVYVDLPNTGLGNKMLVWAKGLCFAQKHGLHLSCSKWWSFQLGAWYRQELKKRVYFDYFNEDSFLKRLQFYFIRLSTKNIHYPKKLLLSNSSVIYVFHQVVTSSDYFEDLKPFREYIKSSMLELLNPILLQKLEKLNPPIIGLHIRRGDFKLGSTITPESYFIDSVIAIRKLLGRDLSVEVFTDAFPEEISGLLSLPNTYLSTPKEDIVDLLLLSRSKICILSIGSTFSFWAATLSDGVVLRHPDEWHPLIRPSDVNESYYEANFDPHQSIDMRLIDKLSCIHFD